MDARDLEVRCTHCNAGFAAGTRTCVHCQRPLGSRLRLAQGGAGAVDADGELPERLGIWGRIGPGVLAALFIGISMISRMCSGDLPH
jgi:hypothetical protein